MFKSLAEMAVFMNISTVKYCPERKESHAKKYHRFKEENVKWIANHFFVVKTRD